MHKTAATSLAALAFGGLAMADARIDLGDAPASAGDTLTGTYGYFKDYQLRMVREMTRSLRDLRKPVEVMPRAL